MNLCHKALGPAPNSGPSPGIRTRPRRVPLHALGNEHRALTREALEMLGPEIQNTSPGIQIQVQTLKIYVHQKYKVRHPNTNSDIKNTGLDTKDTSSDTKI